MSHPKLAVARSGYGGRGYRIPGRLTNERKPKPIVYPSVTTVLKAVAKPGLHQWIADQTAAFAVANVGYLMTVQDEVAWRSLRFLWSREPELVGTAIRKYHEGVRDDAAELGTNIHEWVEADIDGLTEYPEPSAIETEQMIGAWLEWFDQHEITVHRTEFTCVNDDWGMAGTADADWSILCLHEHPCLPGAGERPVRTLVDLKSSRHTWPEHGYQVAALASCNSIMREVTYDTPGAMRAEKQEQGVKVVSWWLEDAPAPWESFALLHIRPADLDTKGQRIEPFCRLIDLTDDMDVYAQGFQGALALTRVTAELKSRAKSRDLGIITATDNDKE